MTMQRWRWIIVLKRFLPLNIYQVLLSEMWNSLKYFSARWWELGKTPPLFPLLTSQLSWTRRQFQDQKLVYLFIHLPNFSKGKYWKWVANKHIPHSQFITFSILSFVFLHNHNVSFLNDILKIVATAKTHQFCKNGFFVFHFIFSVIILPCPLILLWIWISTQLFSQKHIEIILDIICTGTRLDNMLLTQREYPGVGEVKLGAVRLLRTCGWCEGGGCGNYNAIRTTIGRDHNTSYRLIPW